MKLRTVIIDDEVHALDTMKLLIDRYCPGLEIVATARDARSALAVIREYMPDLLFLDIEMPGMSGIEMLEQLNGHAPEVIFVTAYDQYAINAIRMSAMDYLLKPIDPDDLVRAVQRVESMARRTENSEQMEVLISNIKALDKGFQKLAIPDPDGLKFISISDIVSCKADGNYTTITSIDGQSYVISKTLKDTHEMLDHSAFFRTHQSYVINLNFIDRYVRGSGGHLVMQNGEIVQVARARKDSLMKLIYR